MVYHKYPAHKRHPGRDSTRSKRNQKDMSKPVVTLRIFTQAEYDLLKNYLGNKPYKVVG